MVNQPLIEGSPESAKKSLFSHQNKELGQGIPHSKKTYVFHPVFKAFRVLFDFPRLRLPNLRGPTLVGSPSCHGSFQVLVRA